MRIYFGAPSRKEFENIVRILAERNHIEMRKKELLLEAGRWEGFMAVLLEEQRSSLLIIFWGRSEKIWRRLQFAAIDIGSYEVCMKIFELSRKNGLKELNHVRARTGDW